MTTLRPVRVLFSITTVLTLGACTVSDHSFEPRDGEDPEELVTLCHYPPGNPADHETITVGASAVDAHLEEHGDLLGPCPTPCELKCDDVAAAVGEFCEAQPPLPGLPEDFCQTAQGIVEASCDEQCPEPAPEQCNDFCSDLAHQVHFECFELQPDPFICDVGADVTYNECVATFECPPPPPSCFDECFATFDATMMQCEAAGWDPICVDQAHMDLFACEEGCCAAECIESCSMQCADDPLCMEACEADCALMCEPPPPPEPTCEDLCHEQAFINLDACLQSGEDPVLCEQQMFEQLDACLMSCPAPELCPPDLVECPGGFCVLPGEPCPPPPEPTCEELCHEQAMAEHAACVDSGEDPVLCDEQMFAQLDACLMSCPAPEQCPPGELQCPDGVCVLEGEPCPEACPPDMVECALGGCVLPGEPCPS